MRYRSLRMTIIRLACIYNTIYTITLSTEQTISICYTITMTTHYLHLPPRPFLAIKNRTKTVEGRSPDDSEVEMIKKFHPEDLIIFDNEETQEALSTIIVFIHHYMTVREMLEKEGTENVLSSKGSLEEGISAYHRLANGDYERRIKKFGIYAIGIEVLKF